MAMLCLMILAKTHPNTFKRIEKVKNWDSEKLLDLKKNINQERINNLIIELSRPGNDMTPGSVNSIVENICEIFVESAKITLVLFVQRKVDHVRKNQKISSGLT